MTSELHLNGLGSTLNIPVPFRDSACLSVPKLCSLPPAPINKSLKVESYLLHRAIISFIFLYVASSVMRGLTLHSIAKLI